LDFRDSPEEAAFRDRLRGWLTEQKGKFPTSGDAYWPSRVSGTRPSSAAGFFGTSWPKEYGGQDLPPVFDVIVDEESPRPVRPARPSLGYLVVGLSHHGNEELRQRFLPGMINGPERWLPGFSEPWPRLRSGRRCPTTAARDGDEYIINGHKIWTNVLRLQPTGALVLARTDRTFRRNIRDISAFIVSMHPYRASCSVR